MTIAGAAKAVVELVATIWKHGARLLWSFAAAAAVAFIVLIFADRWNLEGAHELKRGYGVYLVLFTAVAAVFAIFKTYSERQGRPLILIANERRSMWGQARQPSGQVLTTISLHFQATNVSNGTVQISGVRLFWPWVPRRNILDAMFLVEAPEDVTFSSRNPILPHSLQEVGAHITINRPIGRSGKNMRVMIKIQDHARKWYWLIFWDVKSATPPAPPAPAV
jgi:hypothetical protein